MKIFIPREMLKDKRLDGYDMIVYSYIKTLKPIPEIKEFYIHLDALLFAVYKKTNIGIRLRENIWNALCNLCELRYIDAKRAGRSAFVIKTSSLTVDTSSQKFVVLYSNDIDKIMASNEHHKAALFLYYMFLMSTFNSEIEVCLESGARKKGIIGDQTIYQIAWITGLSESSILRYNKKIEDLKIMYIHHSDDVFLNEQNQIKRVNNVYGRYEDKDFVDKYAEDYKKHFKSNSVIKGRLFANNDRRLAKMYYWLCQGKKYSREDIELIYKYIVNLNNKYKNLSLKTQDGTYLEKIKDESIFDKFDFLHKE